MRNFADMSYNMPSKLRIFFVVLAAVVLSGCSSERLIPQGSYLLDNVEIRSDDRSFKAGPMMSYVHQKANSKWFSLLRVPMAAYALAGSDTVHWLNRRLRVIGEKPVVYDSVEAERSCHDLTLAMRSMGYMNASADVTARRRKHKVTAVYTLHPGKPWLIGRLDYDIQDSGVARTLERGYRPQLKGGSRFTTDELDAERGRMAAYLADNGYYKFHKDFIQYDADTVAGSRDVGLTLHLLKYRETASSADVPHSRYMIGNITFTGDSSGVHLRRRVLENATALRTGSMYSGTDLQRTYNNFARLQAVRYTSIRFDERRDTNVLDCQIHVSTNKPSTLSFQPEGTNTAGDLGAAASLTYTNRNLFRGSEQLTVQLRGAFEAITGLEGYQDQNYQEYSVETRLSFPRFVAPFLSRSFRRRQTATSELSLRWDMQNRPEFQRRVFSAAWRYRWAEPKHHLNWRYDLLDLNYVYMPWISATFKHDYLDSVSNRNAILRYNYENLFIMKMGAGVSYSDGTDAFRINIETAGNLLSLLSHTGFRRNGEGQRMLFNIAYAQYAKFDADYTHQFVFDERNSLALHAALGIACPYGNSNVLPFEKRYFSGGANSVRGWSVRGLGPGSFRGRDGRIDFINQTGDMKLDLNAEMRTHLFWKLNAAFFVDAGNIWTLRSYSDQPGGQFRFDTFLKQIAVAYGLGLRLNFGYFILRFDAGMKAINPAYESNDEHYAVIHPDFGRDLAFHFAVGLPF